MAAMKAAAMQASPELPSPRFLIAGKLTRDFIVLPSGEILLDVPGGNLVYAACGLAVWEPEPPPALVARVGQDYPLDWVQAFARRGFDTRGIRVLPQEIDVRSFFAYPDRTTKVYENPVPFFAQLGVPFPKVLLGYQSKLSEVDSRTRLSLISIRESDFLPDYMDTTAAHICPVDYLTHSLLPAVLRQAGFTLMTLDPSPGYMNPSFREELPGMIAGLTAFLPSEEEVRNLFQGRSEDLWEMAEALTTSGCNLVIIKRGERGQLLYEADSRTRWEIPSYPAKLVDPTGAGDAFCGGFLAGYRRSFDPLHAALCGNIASSLAIEGHGPFYALEALPGLAHARREALSQAVRKV
ncbi:MAG TPA: carbohydrate kinase family protein [Anaerolineales bacterium]|nr:carbohydrate kinase family protein [Anaerolineales bacterium]